MYLFSSDSVEVDIDGMQGFQWMNEWMNEWMIVVKCQFSNFSPISWREQVNFKWDDDEVRFVLDQNADLDFYSASSLKQQSTDRHVAPLWHIILIPSQPVFVLSS